MKSRNTSLIKVFALVLALGGLALPVFTQHDAQHDKLTPIGKQGAISFDSDVRIGGALLKKGEYIIQHQVEGDDHVFVFKRGIRRYTEVTPGKEVARVKCKVEPLGEKAPHSGLRYGTNAAGEKTVEEIHIKGEAVKHVFSTEGA